jgi:hypothetical protein
VLGTGGLLPWAHPVLGGTAIALASYGASLGLRGRRVAAVRRRHAALMPWVYGLMLLSWAGGLATVWAVREDLEVAASGHFTVGSGIIALFTLGALLSRRVPVDPWARRLHPWVGALALLLSGVQVFLGLEIMSR